MSKSEEKIITLGDEVITKISDEYNSMINNNIDNKIGFSLTPIEMQNIIKELQLKPFLVIDQGEELKKLYKGKMNPKTIDEMDGLVIWNIYELPKEKFENVKEELYIMEIKSEGYDSIYNVVNEEYYEAFMDKDINPIMLPTK